MNWEELLSKVSIESILELRVKSKDNQTKNVFFDFYGFEAILPLDEIANEYGLKHSLFHTIKVGELINLVLINIDRANQRFIFSTRVFRTALNDILSFTKCKLIVEKNKEDHLGIPPKFIIQHRNQLDRLRGDLSSNELTFLYELIQNAVDHSNRNFDYSVSITFEVFNNYLLVKHNGALFTENNFESITGILYGEQQQESDKGRIGYKGIGFKSVFRFTENAYIRSGNFSFRFSKSESGKEKPWEVLPIFQIEKEMVDKIPQFDFFNSPVAFAFEFNNEKNKNDVIKYLNLLSQNPYLLIFLENLSQIKIKAPSVSYTENGLNVFLSPLDIVFRKDLNGIG
ncbi:sacsin N-terminal ATP-binding-like domain-containing protein, partial [Aquirufa beregesia]